MGVFFKKFSLSTRSSDLKINLSGRKKSFITDEWTSVKIFTAVLVLSVHHVSSSYNYLFQKDEVYLNLVLCYVPETVYRVTRHYNKSKQYIPYLYVKVKFYGR